MKFRLTAQSLLATARAAVNRIQISVIVIMCTGIWLAYLAGYYISGSIHSASRWMGATLACTSAVVVLQKTAYRDSLKMGVTRVLGTFIGAAVAYVYLRFFPFTTFGMLVSVFILELLFMLLNIYNNGHIATMTLIIIMLVSQSSPDINPATNCLLRFFESAVGAGIGIGLLKVIELWKGVFYSRDTSSNGRDGRRQNG